MDERLTCNPKWSKLHDVSWSNGLCTKGVGLELMTSCNWSSIYFFNEYINL
jgi:hypothetical protein